MKTEICQIFIVLAIVEPKYCVATPKMDTNNDYHLANVLQNSKITQQKTSKKGLGSAGDPAAQLWQRQSFHAIVKSKLWVISIAETKPPPPAKNTFQHLINAHDNQLKKQMMSKDIVIAESKIQRQCHVKMPWSSNQKMASGKNNGLSPYKQISLSNQQTQQSTQK